MRCEDCVREIARLQGMRDRIGNILLPAWERADLQLDNAQRKYRTGRHVCGGERKD